MRVLLDQGTPTPLRRLLHEHEVSTAFERGWSRLGNGDLLAAAEDAGFDVLLTTDMSLRHQQNLSVRTIAIVVLRTTSWPRIEAAAHLVAAAIGASAVTAYSEVAIP